MDEVEITCRAINATIETIEDEFGDPIDKQALLQMLRGLIDKLKGCNTKSMEEAATKILEEKNVDEVVM